MPLILKATIDHAKLLNRLSIESFLPAHGHSAPKKDIDKYLQANFSVVNFKKELSDHRNEYYFIRHQGKVAGYSKIIFNLPNEHIQTPNIAYMSRLYLLKEFYGLGLGQQLFDFNVKLSKANNQKGIWLAVWVENTKAIKFYTKMGFKIVGSYEFPISKTHSNPNHIMYLAYN